MFAKPFWSFARNSVLVSSRLEGPISTFFTRLESCVDPSTHRFALTEWAQVKSSLFHLAIACVTTPYPDGAASSLVDGLVRSAKVAETDGDVDVSLAAKTALRVCDSLGVPRAPALQYITRETTAADAMPGSSALALEKKVEDARSEVNKALKASVKPKTTVLPKKQELSTKKNEEDAETDSPKINPPSKKQKTEADSVIPEASVQTTQDNNLVASNDYEHAKESDEQKVDEPIVDVKDNEDNGAEDAHDLPEPVSDAGHKEEESDEDEDFPDIVVGGPDSDDE